MICLGCERDCPDTDFLLKQTFCFRCSYAQKAKEAKKIKIRKKLTCKICKTEIKRDPDSKKRQRNVYCSSECALRGHKNISDNHWTRKVHKNSLREGFFEQNYRQIARVSRKIKEQ